MADETVWIDLDEVEAAAKKILGLLDELSGPANQLEAKVKQVKETVYGTDLVGKAIQGGSSSVGGLADHQEQVLQGIRTLIQNATAVGENLQSMAARHRANDEQQATALGGVMGDGTMPAGPRLAGLGPVLTGTTATSPDSPLLDGTGTAQATPEYLVRGTETTTATLPHLVRGTEVTEGTRENLVRGTEVAEGTLPHLVRGTEVMEGTLPHLVRGTEVTEGTPLLQARPMETVQAMPAHPAPPPPNEGLGTIDPGGEHHSVEVPDLHYNAPPPPPFIGPGMWTPTGHGV
ncbi:WXG100 family type VII secretion target [Kitasatospora sp. NPDC057198]|uniref:WXG100 family type VII secretion target n=1 Tax=Kitasatospora sp. NPDC057198 TaxID=3346046 RepID=UPI0036282026